MIKIQDYIENEIELLTPNSKDKEIYYQIKKETCQKYVKECFGGWNEKEQREYNDKIFDESLKQDYFKIIAIRKQTVGFFGYSIFEKEIGCVTLQIVKTKGRNKIFESFLNYLSALAEKHKLPIFAKTFLVSKDIEIYKKAGFEIMSKTTSHYLLKKNQGEHNGTKRI